MQSMTFKTGDTPPVRAQLTDNGVPLNLTGASVVFLMRDVGGGSVDVEQPATIEGLPVNGEVRYDWNAGETDTPGEYEAVFRVTFASGKVQTFPNDDYILIVIEAAFDSGTVPTIPALPDLCWPIDEGCCADFDNYAPSVRARAKALAAQTIRALTAGRVGGCATKVRPCSAAYCDGAGVYWEQGYLRPVNWSGTWTNMACGCLNACYHGSGVELQGPVGRVDEVKVDGVVLAPTAYYVSGRRLYRTDGTAWPVTQNMTVPDTEPGTFSVTYLRAYPVDGLGAYAAGILACEYAKACSGGKCRLPSGVTEIARAGVTMTIASGAFPDGLTGIREVDAYVMAWNPQRAKMASEVWSPGR